MDHHIRILAELHWAVKRPVLQFLSGQQILSYHLCIIDREDFIERVEYSLDMLSAGTTNILSIEMINKTDDLTNEKSDHWVDIKNIFVDGIPADWLLQKTTKFRHSMTKDWVDDMQSRGFDILPEYFPGTELRLNGTCYFEFEHPFLIQRITADWKKSNEYT
jgi:hypothetical protein